ncbi:MAG: DUF1932 domain-containing protein [Pseudomonadota bacterium]
MTDVMPPSTVGVLGFGAMGAGVAWALRTQGFDVATCVSDRSTATQARARAGDVMQCPDLAALVARSDTFLSIVPADQAIPLAESVMACCAERERPLHYVDCNSITPRKTEAIAALIARGGGVFSDAGIIGPPPAPNRNATRFYTSGPHRAVLNNLATPEMQVRPLGEGLTEATQMKVLFAGINKGTVALLMNVLAAAQRANLSDAVMAEVDSMRPGLLDVARRPVRELSGKAARWSLEMEDIAEALEDLGCDGGYHSAAAKGYHRLAEQSADSELGESSLPEMLHQLLACWPRRA